MMESGSTLELVADAPRTPATRFKLIEFNDVVMGDQAPYLVKGLIPTDGLTVIWGPPKCGKSFWAHDVAMHVALGWEYRGRTVKRGPVVYVACEGERGLRARIEAWRRDRLETYENFVPLWLLPTRLNLIEEWPELCNAIRTALSVVDPVAIVIDTLNRSLAGSENSDEDMAAYVGACDMIRECFPGVAVIVVHHCGHDATRPRGHTSLIGALDAQIAVKRLGDDTIVTEVERMKDGAEGAKTVSKLKVVEVGIDEDGDAITSCVVEPCEPTAADTDDGPRLTANQNTMFTILHSAGSAGLTVDRWNEKARSAGLGNNRKADLFDFREALRRKQLVHEYDGRWHADR